MLPSHLRQSDDLFLPQLKPTYLTSSRSIAVRSLSPNFAHSNCLAKDEHPSMIDLSAPARPHAENVSAYARGPSHAIMVRSASWTLR
jgi:hypothetical protein